MSQTKAQLINAVDGSIVDADIVGLTASKLSGALPAISAANLTSVPFANRNLIINGAMEVAQRGTSSTSKGYYTVDRFKSAGAGEDEAITQEQVDVAAGTTPYTLGFRKAWKLTNGNQTGGAGASDYVQPEYRIEAQDIAKSGWNYTSNSSFITVSFWVKSSVAGDYTFNLEAHDGTAHRYLMEYTLSADTWTKVTKTIPGNSNLTFDNDNGHGGTIYWYPYLGSTYVQADQENNWYASSNGKYGTTSTTTWWTTNDATWEITGVQLEVGSSATEFEHLSYGDTLLKCQRYFFKTGDVGTSNEWFPGVATYASDGNFTTMAMESLQDRSAPSLRFPCYMRDAGTVVFYPGRSGATNTANNINGFVSNTLVTTSTKPTASVGGLEYYFQGTSEDSNAYVFQCTVDSEL